MALSLVDGPFFSASWVLPDCVILDSALLAARTHPHRLHLILIRANCNNFHGARFSQLIKMKLSDVIRTFVRWGLERVWNESGWRSVFAFSDYCDKTFWLTIGSFCLLVGLCSSDWQIFEKFVALMIFWCYETLSVNASNLSIIKYWYAFGYGTVKVGLWATL